MTLYEELLWGCLRDLPVQVTFPNLTVNPNDLVEMKSFLAIERTGTFWKKKVLPTRSAPCRFGISFTRWRQKASPFKTGKKKKGPPPLFLFLTLLFFCPSKARLTALQPAARSFAACVLHLRQIPFLRLPGGADFVQIPPYAHRKPC